MTALKSIRWRKPTPEKPPEPPVVDLDKLETALNETSRRAAAQWLGFLSLWAYLFFTTVAVTDYDLLVETPVKLPLIGVELGLFSFFVWTPALFLVVHLYIARKVALLARQAAFYRKQILAQKVAGAHLAARENRLDAFAVTGLLLRFDGGEDQPPDRLLTGFTALTVYVTLFVLPLALYAAFLVYFLAYQHEFTTWWHRVALLLGAGLAVYGVYLSSPPSIRGGVFEVNTVLALLIVGPAFLLFTFPGERLHEHSFADHVLRGPLHINRLRPRQPAHLFAEMKKAGKLDEASQLDLAGRDFSGRALRNADLSGANLRRARFISTDMQGADLRSAYMQGADLRSADMQGADLKSAYMQGADLSSARLQMASLDGARLQGADLQYVNLQGADLRGTRLQGADLLRARLQGADLSGAWLQGADLSGAYLQGAVLRGAGLQATDLAGTRHSRSRTSNIRFFGDSEPSVNIDGATLGFFPLQGVKLWSAGLIVEPPSGAYLQGADLRDAVFWKTVLGVSELEAILVGNIKVELQGPSKEQVDEWLDEIPPGQRRDIARELLDGLTAWSIPYNKIATVRRFEAAAEGVTPYARAAVVGAALCQEIFGHFALQGVIHKRLWSFSSIADLSAATLQARIQDVERCPAARGLTDYDKRQLAVSVARQHQAWLRAEAAEWFARAGLGAGAAL